MTHFSLFYCPIPLSFPSSPGVGLSGTRVRTDVCLQKAGEDPREEAERRSYGSQRETVIGKARQQICGESPNSLASHCILCLCLVNTPTLVSLSVLIYLIHLCSSHYALFYLLENFAGTSRSAVCNTAPFLFETLLLSLIPSQLIDIHHTVRCPLSLSLCR